MRPNLIIGGMLSLLFLGNFSNLWHLSVLAWTFLTPVLSVFSLIVYHCRPDLRTMSVSLSLSACTLLIYVIWTAPWSRGLVH